MLTAIETTGIINANNQIVLDEDFPETRRVVSGVIVLFDEDADISEKEWLKAVSKNDAFEFLKMRLKIFTL